jgi:hypothetical protein
MDKAERLVNKIISFREELKKLPETEQIKRLKVLYDAHFGIIEKKTMELVIDRRAFTSGYGGSREKQRIPVLLYVAGIPSKTYDSISEASKQMKIPYSTIRNSAMKNETVLGTNYQFEFVKKENTQL